MPHAYRVSLKTRSAKPRFFAAISALAIVLAAAMLHAPATAQPNMLCKPSTGGHGVAPGKAIAKIKAKNHWSKLVTNAYGESWAQFSNAQDAGFKCRQTATLWGCALNAAPCKQLDLAKSENGEAIKTAQ